MKRFWSIYFFLSAFLLTGLQAQDPVRIELQSGVDNDSLQALIKKHKILQAVIYASGEKKILSGKKLKDTLYVHVNKKKYHVLQDSLYLFLTALNDSLIARGQIFNRIKPQKISLANNVLHLFYTVEQPGYFVIDSLVYSSSKFPRNVRRRLYRKFKGKQISRENFNKIKKFILLNTRFELEEPPSVVFSSGKQWVRIVTRKALTNTAEGVLGLGYAPDTRKLQLQGSFHTSIYNVFNVNETAKIDWQSTGASQILQVYLDMPFVAGTGFSMDNRLNTGRHDTLQAFFYEKIQLKFTTGRHTWKSGFITDRQNDNRQHTYNYLTTGYRYTRKLKQLEQTLNIDIQYDTSQKKMLGFVQLNLKYHLYNNFFMHNLINLMYNDTSNPLSQTAQTLEFYRRFDNIRINAHRISAFKNELIWQKKELNLYVIADYIHEKKYENPVQLRINTGMGIKIVRKNQILTFELIKPFDFNYVTDNQSLYINVKQEFKF